MAENESTDRNSVGSTEEEIETASRPGPNDPPWGVIVSVAFWLLSVILITIVPLVLLVPYFGPERFSGRKQEQLQQSIFSDPYAVLLALAGTFGAHILTLIIGWLIVTRYNRYGFREMLGWEWGGFKFWHGAAIFAGVYVFAIVMAILLGSQDNEMRMILRSSRAAVFAVAFIATFSAPLVEEVVYRGVLYSAFQRSFGVPIAVAGVTLIFALVHVGQYYPDMATIVSILLLSLTLTLIRAKTDNLLPCVVFHLVFNGYHAILLILQPYLPVPVDPTSVQSFILPI